VEHAAVVRRLVHGEVRLLLEQEQRKPRPLDEQPEGRCEADDPASDDGDVEPGGHGVSLT
jgi:hypothetical protein